MLDLRIPSGMFFAAVGVILVLMPDVRAPLTVGNVNLRCGIFMCFFGLGLLLLARRGRK